MKCAWVRLALKGSVPCSRFAAAFLGVIDQIGTQVRGAAKVGPLANGFVVRQLALNAFFNLAVSSFFCVDRQEFIKPPFNHTSCVSSLLVR